MISEGNESGEHESSTGYKSSFSFDINEGKYITYQVENIGRGDISIQINGSQEKLIKANTTESLSYELKRNNESLTFKSNSKNDRVHIKYDIRQNKTSV